MKLFRPLLGCLAAAALALPAAGQSNATKSLGTAKGGGKLLSREELRACLSQQKSLAARKPALQATREQLEREREQLDGAQASLNADRVAIDKLKDTATELNTRTQQLSQRIADFNERVTKNQNAGLSGPTAERQRVALDREKAALDKATKELDDERSALSAQAAQQGKAYDERVGQANRAADDWNARSAQFKRELQGFDRELEDWRSDCEGRSYREDDEKAILSGR